MSSHRNLALVILLVFASLMFFTTAQLRADLIYQLKSYPLDQGGHTLSGTITTDGTIGDLGATDFPLGYYNFRPQFGGHIKSATYQIDNDPLYNVTEIPNAWCEVVATATQILVYPGNPYVSTNSPFVLYTNVPSVGVWDIEWFNSRSDTTHYYGSDRASGTVWQTVSPSHITMGPNYSWVIATIVPEPATLVFLVTALLGFAGFVRVRRR
jgi:hypothetical protein